MVPDRRRAHSDRRNTHRLPAVFAVKNHMPPAMGSKVLLGQAEDICPGGITLRRPRDTAFSPADTVHLSFELPGLGAEIAVAGVVVQDLRVGRWRRTGVRFEGVAAEDQRLLDQYCASLIR